MQALILNDDRTMQAAMAMALFKRNFQVVTADDVDTAAAYANLGIFDLVVMAERVRGRLSHSVALAAELRNPDVTTMLLTGRTDQDVDELYELLPSLYCLLGDRLDAELVARMAVAGVIGKVRSADRALRAELEAAAAAPEGAADEDDWIDWPEAEPSEAEDEVEVPEHLFAARDGAAPVDIGPVEIVSRVAEDRLEAAAAARAAGEFSPALAEIIARAAARLRVQQGGEALPLPRRAMAGESARSAATAA